MVDQAPATYSEDRLHSWLKIMYQKSREDGNHRWLTYNKPKDEYALWIEKPDKGRVIVATTMVPRHKV